MTYFTCKSDKVKQIIQNDYYYHYSIKFPLHGRNKKSPKTIQIYLQRNLMFPASPAAPVSDIAGKQTN